MRQGQSDAHLADNGADNLRDEGPKQEQERGGGQDGGQLHGVGRGRTRNALQKAVRPLPVHALA